MSKILVIDDSPSALEVMANMLSEGGHEARLCRDGDSARTFLELETFDLIVTDVYMPNTDGLEVILEQRRARPRTPVVAVSGMTGPRNLLAVAKRLGACQTIQKPFTKTQLLTAIATALGTMRDGPPVPDAELANDDVR